MDRNAVLADYQRWLHWKAQTLLGPYRAEGGAATKDLAQEGYIAMWRALDTYDPEKGSLPSWLTGAAELRMRSLFGHGRPFGSIPQRGTVRVEDAASVRSLDSIAGPAELAELEQRVAYWLPEGLALAYHEGDISRAIGELTPEQRVYVTLRFWEGKTDLEIQPHVTSNVRYLWAGPKGARAKLRASLRRLEAS